MRFHISGIGVSRVGIRRGVKVGILPCDRKNVIFGLVDFRGGIVNCGGLGVLYQRRRLLPESGAGDFVCFFSTSGCWLSVCALRRRRYGG